MFSSAVKTKFVWLMSASYTNGQTGIGSLYRIGDHTKGNVCKCDSEFCKQNLLNLPEPNNLE